MPLFSRKIPYDRKQLLKAAEAATKKRRFRRAVVLYRQILAAERRNPQIHARIAPLLARTGNTFDAWESYQIAVDTPEFTDDPQHCVAHFAKAAAALPKNVDAWRALSRARLRCQDPDAALAALLDGRKRFRKRRSNSEAIVLLRDALDLDPWKPEIVLDLCRLLKRSGQSTEALFLLDALDGKTRGSVRAETRALIWRIDPTFGNSWRWIRARAEAKRSDSPGMSHRKRRA